MGSRFSYKAEEVMPIHVNQSFDYNAITNSDPVFPKEEANDKTKEDEVHIPVEEQQEKDQVKKQEEENDEDMADEVKLEVEKKEEEGNQEGSSKETEASRDSHRARLLSNATKCGLRLRSDVLGDGNCYFRALADQLERIGLLESVNTTSHEELREGICDYMQYHPIPGMQHFVSLEYISNMRQNHKWAGEPEIVATRKKYGVNMKLVTSAECSTANEFYEFDFPEENATETLYLGHIHEKHYVSLEPDDYQDLTKDRGAPAMSSAGKLKGSLGETDATQGKLKGSHGGTDATPGKLKGSHGGTDATPGNQEGSREGAEASTETTSSGASSAAAATNQVERPMPQQENWRVHMEELKRHQEEWRVHMDELMLHQEQWRVHMEGLMQHQEQWRVHMEGLMQHQEIQTLTPPSTGKPEMPPLDQPGEPTTMKCRVLSGAVALVFFVLCFLPIFFYISCFLGDKKHYLRFFGHMSYRPSLVLAPLIILVAAFKAPEDPYTSWDNVFVLSKSSREARSEAFKNNQDWSKCSTGFIYFSVPALVLVFKTIFYLTTITQCHWFFLTVWFVTEFCGVVFFALFCWFLYRQRLVVQDESKKASGLLCHDEGQFRRCIISIKKFFKVYYPLRSLMLPLVYIFLFESSFGIGSYLTWHYQNGDPSNGTSYTTIQPNSADTTDGCPINCPALDFSHLKSSVPYNIWIVSRHIMTILLPYWSASGMDMKYIWDDFMTKCTYTYGEEHESFWRKITAYMKGLHSKTSTYTVLNIIVPLLALVAGIFTGNQF